MSLGSVDDRHILRRLRKEGWRPSRQTGSHLQWWHPDKPHRRVTTVTTGMSPNVKRSVYQQAGWLWQGAEIKLQRETEHELRRLDKENEELRRELHQLLVSIDAWTAPPQRAAS